MTRKHKEDDLKKDVIRFQAILDHGRQYELNDLDRKYLESLEIAGLVTRRKRA